MTRYFTVPEAASIMGKSQHVIRYMIRRGKIDAVPAEGKEKWLIPDSVVYDALRQGILESKVCKAKKV